jgi:TPR repeat protein
MASMYSTGEGVPKNLTEAAAWLHKAFVAIAKARTSLAAKSASGRGISADWREWYQYHCAEWYREAFIAVSVITLCYLQLRSRPEIRV